MNFKLVQIKKAKWWQEIKSLEQEYKRNISQIRELEERQSDISFEVQKRLDKMQKEAEKYDQYCFENKLGVFKESYKLINEIFCEFADIHYSHATDSYIKNLKDDFNKYLLEKNEL